MTTTRTLTRLSASTIMTLAVAVCVPAFAAAEPMEQAPPRVPYCEALPMIMIYPPPPTTIYCDTGWGDFTFTLPPGTHWPF